MYSNSQVPEEGNRRIKTQLYEIKKGTSLRQVSQIVEELSLVLGDVTSG